MEAQKLCKRLTYSNGISGFDNRVILGIVISQDNDFIIFKTARNEYQISKKNIVTLEPTNILFIQVQQ